MAVADVWAFGTLLIAAFGLGTALLSALSPPCEDRTEFAALAASAGFGAMGVFLGILGLFGSLHAARFLIPLGAVTTLVWIAKRSPGPAWPVLSRPSPGMALLIMMVAAALLGSIAPVTDIDSLDYPIPIAQHLVRDGNGDSGPTMALFLTVGPWLIRTWRVSGAPVLSSQTGRALWIGNNSETFS